MAPVNFFVGRKILHMEALNSLREEIEGLGCLTKELGQFKIGSLTFTVNNFTCFLLVISLYLFVVFFSSWFQLCIVWSWKCFAKTSCSVLHPGSFMIHHKAVTVNNRITLIARHSIDSQIQVLLQL